MSRRAPDRYADVAARLLEAAAAEQGAARYVQHLADRIGPRLAGSAGGRAAVAWAAAEIRCLGVEPVPESVVVPVWLRGEESARILAPVEQRVAVTALGSSVPTPPRGLRADVVEADSLASLTALGEAQVRGRIVLFNAAMKPGLEGYGAVVGLRNDGASAAARLGAVGILVRSVGTSNHRLPHTGCVVYAGGVRKIPAAAIAAEDADLIHRLLVGGNRVSVELRLGCKQGPDALGANVVAEIPGRDRPEEIVLIGAHLDSWDLGTGAIDDAAGVGMVLDTLRILQTHGLIPRRSIRAVLFANEENGLNGGLTYAVAHAAELDRHVVAMEADAGAGRPEGFAVHAGPGGAAYVADLGRLLMPGGSRVVERIDGPDIEPLAAHGVPLLGVLQDESRYFDWHHTAADTFDKIDPHALAKSAGVLAAAAYLLAEDEMTLPRPALTRPRPAETASRSA